MELKATHEGSRARFEINGDIDERAAEELKKRFRELKVSSLEEAVFDFKKVNHIGSAGIGKLLLFYKDLAASGGKIYIVNVNTEINNLFNLLKLDTIFTISRA